MPKKILIVSGSPKKNGNTAALVAWFAQGAQSRGAWVETVFAAFLKHKTMGCLSCRQCQTCAEYECVVGDEVRDVLEKMVSSDVIVMATPLYFFGPSAQLKLVLDRMFSLYKWDNAAGTMKTVLKGKTLVLLASAFETVGLQTLRVSFKMIADYTGMKFFALLIPNAGISGQIKDKPYTRTKTIVFGKKFA